jgi:hypothetical protein
VSIFYQSDIRRDGEWIDKSYLVLRAVEAERANLVWHKIVCRRPPGTIALGRPSYSHMLRVSRGRRSAPTRPGPDVLPDAGFTSWTRAIGTTACRVACRFLLEETATRLVVDPFCGRGTVLAVANAAGLPALGIDISAKRCRAARKLLPQTLELGDRRVSRQDAFAEGARLFDAGAFFEAHEAWEARWRSEREAAHRLFLQGLIQVAAAFHKQKTSPAAGVRLLTRALTKLDASPAEVDGFDVLRFRATLHDVLRAMEADAFDAGRIPKILH